MTLLDADGKVKDTFNPRCTNGSLTPGSDRLAAIEFMGELSDLHGKLAIRPFPGSGDMDTIPLTWDRPGLFGSALRWTPDGKRLLICEYGIRDQSKYRIYDASTKAITELRMPAGSDVVDWSPDGKQLLISRKAGACPRELAWLDKDGATKFVYAFSPDESVYGERLSPDGKRIVCMAGPKPGKDKRWDGRLTVIDLATKKRTVVDEPGHTHGHCWSPDGTRIAYTWQRQLEKPEEVEVRETHLFTCRADGMDRKSIASRKTEVKKNNSGRGSVVFIFLLIEWR